MSSYREAVKSSILIGGTQVISILLGIVRTKVLAILLGPAGLGVVELYRTAIATIASVAGCGLNNSGVRQVAQANAVADVHKIARTITALRRVCLWTGMAGLFVVLSFSVPLSKMTFGDNHHTWGMVMMSLTVLLGNVSAGQYALLQGMRRIRDLAKCQIFGAVIGTFAGILIIYWLGEDGITFYLAVLAVAGFAVSWHYARQIKLPSLEIRWLDVAVEARIMLRLGMAFLLTGLITSSATYASRLFIIWKLGVGSVGLFTASWTLSSLYVGFVLAAMGTDFYPRLTGVSDNNAACNRLINEQTEVGLLFAVPGVLGTLALAPLILQLFYSKDFIAAGEIVRWLILGVPLQVATYSLGYLQVAKGRGRLFVAKEFVVQLVYLVALWVATTLWGLVGLGIYYVIARLIHLGIEYVIARHLSGFRWSFANHKIFFITAITILLVWLAITHVSGHWGVALGLVIVTGWVIFSLLTLHRLSGGGPWQRLWHKPQN